MRKYLIGFIVGVLVATASVAAADSISLIGKKIQSEAIVTLDGEEIGTAIITDGTSFAPIRVVAEATGLKVGYEKGNVKLESITGETKSLSYWESSLKSLTELHEGLQKLVVNREETLKTSQETLDKWQAKLDSLADDASSQTRQSIINTISDLEKGHSEIEAELKKYQDEAAETEAEITQVKAEIAKLQAK